MRKNRKRRKGPTKPVGLVRSAKANGMTVTQDEHGQPVARREGDGGTCFVDALKLAAKTPGSYVVHGIPVGRGPLNNGKRYWHAWVEFREQGQWFCAWVGNDDRAVKMDLLRYYEAGHLTMEDVCRWEAEAAIALAVQTEQAGPWACDTTLRLDRRVPA